VGPHAYNGSVIAAPSTMRRSLLLAVALFGCAEQGSTGPDPCNDLYCATSPPTLTLTVLDTVSKQPVTGVLEFRDGNQPLPFACTAVVDATTPCPSWVLTRADSNLFDVTVSAHGYASRTLQERIPPSAGCCGGPTAFDSLELQPLTP
jgi:hypothetical protein